MTQLITFSYAGEAVYVDDIPSPPNCLHGAFIYSQKPFARVTSIELDSESHSDGVTALISFRDIPKGGENIGSNSSYGPEPLFADELTKHSGQRLALVVGLPSPSFLFNYESCHLKY